MAVGELSQNSADDVSVQRSLGALGYAMITSVLSDRDTENVIREVGDLDVKKAGQRRLLEAPWCMDLADRLRMHESLRQVLGSGAKALDCTLFVKSASRNWLVSLHQDLSIPADEHWNQSDWNGWSFKDGRQYAQPPVAVLEHLVALRLHLDNCDYLNGALRVVPASHRFGRMSPADVLHRRNVLGEQSITASRGDVMLMRPLLLHASSKSASEGIRRVLQFLFRPSAMQPDVFDS